MHIVKKLTPHRIIPRTALSVSFLLVTVSAALAQGIVDTRPQSDGLITQEAQSDFANPWPERPACASMFLKSDFVLTPRQRACDWIQNGVFGNSGLFGAAWSAEVSKLRDAPSERGDAFSTRFGRRYVQNAFKSTGAYLGGTLAGEDPRMEPPYLAMSPSSRPKGFLRRARHALAYNFVSYHCNEPCSRPEDIRRRPALSRVTGALASGYASEIWTWNDSDSHRRALYGAATAYGSSFVGALFTEFKPEVMGFAARTFGGLFGFR